MKLRNRNGFLVGRAISLIQAVLLLMFFALTTHAVAGVSQQRSFIADMIQFNKHQTHARQSGRLFVGEQGWRLESGDDSGQQPTLIHIENRTQGKAWTLEPSRRIFTQFQETETQQEVDEMGGIMSPEPCMGAQKVRVKSTTWQGLDVVEWSCNQPGGVTHMQLYSAELGMVVRDESASGDVGQLENIQTIEADQSRFQPPAGYREVSPDAFFSGERLQLPTYQESPEP